MAIVYLQQPLSPTVLAPLGEAISTSDLLGKVHS